MAVSSRLIIGLLLGTVALGGCGRSELLDLQGGSDPAVERDVDFSRELTLVDESVVLVELIAPSPSDVRVALIKLEDGVSLDEVIATLTPENDAEVELDTSGALPEMRVYRNGELRGIIWM